MASERHMHDQAEAQACSAVPQYVLFGGTLSVVKVSIFGCESDPTDKIPS